MKNKGKSKLITWEENEKSCFICTSHGPNSKGYPLKRIGFKKKKLISHIIYEECFGEIPDNMNVCHKCDTPMCINPEHLFLGTHKDNSDDKIRKGRQKYPSSGKGEFHVTAKLTTKQVLCILSDKRLHKEIAKNYDISRQHVGRLKRHERWSHIAI